MSCHTVVLISNLLALLTRTIIPTVVNLKSFGTIEDTNACTARGLKSGGLIIFYPKFEVFPQAFFHPKSG